MRTIRTMILACVGFVLSSGAYSKDGRLRCRAVGDGNRQAEIRVEPGKFRAKWQINKGQGQDVGTLVRVLIAGQFIGEIVLKDDGNQLEGKLEYKKRDLPNSLPKIVEGTQAQVGSLTCTFREE